jgi:hypothetical protein
MAPDRSKGGRKYTQGSSHSKVQCRYCDESYDSRGLKSHEDSCRRRKEKKKEDEGFARAVVQSILKEGKRSMFPIRS